MPQNWRPIQLDHCQRSASVNGLPHSTSVATTPEISLESSLIAKEFHSTAVPTTWFEVGREGKMGNFEFCN
jgi:hypothetical protein